MTTHSGIPSRDGRLPRAPFARQEVIPGREAALLAALVIGLLMLGIQLWMLTVALELFLAGDGEDIWQLAIGSGLVVVGGLLMVRLLSRRPRVGRAE